MNPPEPFGRDSHSGCGFGLACSWYSSLSLRLSQSSLEGEGASTPERSSGRLTPIRRSRDGRDVHRWHVLHEYCIARRAEPTMWYFRLTSGCVSTRRLPRTAACPTFSALVPQQACDRHEGHYVRNLRISSTRWLISLTIHRTVLLPCRVAPTLHAADLTVAPEFPEDANDGGTADPQAGSLHVGVAEGRRQMPDTVDHHLALRAPPRPVPICPTRCSNST